MEENEEESDEETIDESNRQSAVEGKGKGKQKATTEGDAQMDVDEIESSMIKKPSVNSSEETDAMEVDPVDPLGDSQMLSARFYLAYLDERLTGAGFGPRSVPEDADQLRQGPRSTFSLFPRRFRLFAQLD